MGRDNMADNNYTDKEVDGLDDTAGRVETYHNAVYITVKRYGREIKEGWAKFDPAHGREFAAHILAACDIAEGIPPRPAAIEDVPLQYEHRADINEASSLEFIPYRDNRGRFPMAGDDSDTEDGE